MEETIENAKENLATYTVARFFSYIFHPLLMPVYSIFILFHFYTYLDYSIAPIAKKFIYGVVVFNTIIAPVIISLILLKKGTIKSLEMESKEERVIPFFATALFYIFACILFYSIPLPRIFFLIALGATLSVIIAFLINLAWKVSAHMIGIGGVMGIILGISQRLLIDMTMPVLLGFILAGILGSSRLRLKAHSPLQIYVGFSIGFVLEFLILLS